MLDSENKEAAEEFFDELGRFGLFAVRGGEVEQWLAALDIERSKHTWLHNIFEKMGAEPSAPDYVAPDMGDVWDFIGSLNAWFKDPNRKGMSGAGGELPP